MYVPILDCFLILAQGGKPRVLMLPLSVVADVALMPPWWHHVSLASLRLTHESFCFLSRWHIRPLLGLVVLLTTLVVGGPRATK